VATSCDFTKSSTKTVSSLTLLQNILSIVFFFLLFYVAKINVKLTRDIKVK